MGELLARLQRLGGQDVEVDPAIDDASLALDTQIAAIELEGFGDQPPPPLTDLRLRGRVAVPAAADAVEFEIAELVVPALQLAARGHGDPRAVRLDEITLVGGDALNLGGDAELALPPNAGSLRADLTGDVDLARIMEAIRMLQLRKGENEIELRTFDKEYLERAPQIALISGARKFLSLA